MKILNQAIELLNKPFQSETSAKKELVSHFFIGLFVMAFLWFFEPFGLSEYKGNILFITSLFGLATWITGVIFFLITHYVLRIRQDLPSWTFFRWMIYVLCLILAIAFANYLIMGVLSGWSSLSFRFFIDLLLKTLAVGLFPVALSGLISLYKNERKNLQVAGSIQLPITENLEEDTQLIELQAFSGSHFECPQERLLFFEANQNYVSIYYLDEHGAEKESLIRATLSSIGDQLPADSFLKCHRSFILNLHRVATISGNAQGLVVSLKDSSLNVPVSRSYIKAFKERVSQI